MTDFSQLFLIYKTYWNKILFQEDYIGLELCTVSFTGYEYYEEN